MSIIQPQTATERATLIAMRLHERASLQPPIVRAEDWTALLAAWSA